MSWKGFKKSVVRAPQTFRSKFNIGEHTKDPIYEDAGRRFKSLETEAKKLSEDTTKYTEAIHGLLNHQVGFADACIEIYNPISGRASDPESYRLEGSEEGVQAAEAYKDIVHELESSLASELEVIETRIVQPTAELLHIIRSVEKFLTKRDHKQIDYDRHRATLKRLQEKKDRSLKDEKHLYEAETSFDQASQEYEYYNDMVKEELPRLFELEQDFIAPLFQGLYYMQLNIFWILYQKMSNFNIPYFDMNSDIITAYEEKRSDVRDRTEALTITRFKTGRPARKHSGSYTGHSSPSSSSSFSNKREDVAGDATSVSASSPTSSAAATSEVPPPYTSIGAQPSAMAAATAPEKPASFTASTASAPPAPPIKPKFKPAVPPVEYVTALYDYTAQAAGDLSFHAGDRIEVVSRSDNQNEWWIGRLHNSEGQFPGNYVQLDEIS
ncbi:BAR adaptor protein Hob1 [Schizosaccharomyces cryophilus OY26]|uniref:BAR adaptor protein Hob1 n=1 Tax=Schizosaccharomyces cryophilus (strain OY26 / ATCC MYA-4695 / CBS 11777 / NBRC 106824 / NRRL Y48691) TaxID=653667 RepID=S9X707_SCHCR|nr:BAR adaptor protein Hob1 [Schizosaccharomyces cryophilus OY26]EPY52847.1 BAR adaptor protein Hob1 [Schizosaccharomyces cryophilus OY26]